MKKMWIFVVLIILILSLFWQCSREDSQPFSRDAEQEIALLPAQASGLGFLNIKAIRESPFFAMVKENLEENPFYSKDYQEFLDATGLDIRKDIEELYFCLIPEENQEKPELFALIKGNYDPQKITEYILQNSDEGEVVTSSYAEHTIYNLDDDKFAFCFADNSRLILGNENQLKTWLDRTGERKKTRITAEMQRRLKDVRYKGEAWVSMDAKGFVEKMMNEMNRHSREGRFEALKSLQNMNASAKFDERLSFHGMSQFSDKENAKLFHDALKGFIATAKLSVSQDRKAVDVLNKINTEIRGDRIILDFKMSKEDINRLKKKKEELAVL